VTAESAPIRLWYLPMPGRRERHKLGPMTEMYSTLDRLEARIEHQDARIDALYRLLETRGLLPVDAEEATLLEDIPFEDAPLCRERYGRPAGRPPHRLRVGEATGV
jgi:hypothetical protein